MSQIQDLSPRERRSAASKEHSSAQAARQAADLVCVHYGGRQFVTSFEMAGIFLRRAQQLIDAGDAQLVPLRHDGGLELLHVAADIPFSIHDASAVPADGSHSSVTDSL